MGFDEWGDEDFKVELYTENQYILKTKGTRFVFNTHDFMELYNRISGVAEHIFDKEVYYIHDGNIHNRETGQQFLGVVDDCEELNRLYDKYNKIVQLLDDEFNKYNRKARYASEVGDEKWETYYDIRNVLKEVKEKIK